MTKKEDYIEGGSSQMGLTNPKNISQNGKTKDSQEKISYVCTVHTDVQKERPTQVSNSDFLKNMLNQSEALTKTDTFLKFCNAYDLDFSKDPIRTYRTYCELLDELQGVRLSMKDMINRFKVLYLLQKAVLQSFTEIKDSLNIHQQDLSRIVDDLLKLGFIRKIEPINKEAKQRNDILKYGGGHRASHFYKLNIHNEIIQERGSDIGIYINKIDPHFVNIVDEDVKDWVDLKKEYEKHLDIVNQTRARKEQKQKTTMQKVCIALCDLIPETETESEPCSSQFLTNFLTWERGVISERYWQGRPDRFGNRRGMMEYLISKGILKSVNPESVLLVVTKKALMYLGDETLNKVIQTSIKRKDPYKAELDFKKWWADSGNKGKGGEQYGNTEQ